MAQQLDFGLDTFGDVTRGTDGELVSYPQVIRHPQPPDVRFRVGRAVASVPSRLPRQGRWIMASTSASPGDQGGPPLGGLVAIAIERAAALERGEASGSERENSGSLSAAGAPEGSV